MKDESEPGGLNQLIAHFARLPLQDYLPLAPRRLSTVDNAEWVYMVDPYPPPVDMNLSCSDPEWRAAPELGQPTWVKNDTKGFLEHANFCGLYRLQVMNPDKPVLTPSNELLLCPGLMYVKQMTPMQWRLGVGPLPELKPGDADTSGQAGGHGHRHASRSPSGRHRPSKDT